MIILGIEDKVYIELRKEKLLERYLAEQLIYLIDENGVVCNAKENVTILDIENYNYVGALYGVSTYVNKEFDKIIRSD